MSVPGRTQNRRKNVALNGLAAVAGKYAGQMPVFMMAVASSRTPAVTSFIAPTRCDGRWRSAGPDDPSGCHQLGQNLRVVITSADDPAAQVTQRGDRLATPILPPCAALRPAPTC